MKTISVIVITYKRCEELKNTIDRLIKEINEFDELVLVDNCSGDGTKEYGEFLATQYEKIRFFSLDTNMGVAAGRNFAVKQSKGDILYFIDDDAVPEEKGSFNKVRQKFEEDDKVGVLAFRITNFYSGISERKEIPFTDKSLDLDQERLTSTYIGAGHAIRREVFETCGYYPENYQYGGEELDLSFRIIDCNYEILYYPSVNVLHKQNPAGRVENDRKWILIYRNRLLTSYSYLPQIYHMFSGMLWFVKVLLLSKKLSVPINGYQEYRHERVHRKRVVVSEEAMKYLKKYYGRLWH